MSFFATPGRRPGAGGSGGPVLGMSPPTGSTPGGSVPTHSISFSSFFGGVPSTVMEHQRARNKG